MATFDLQRFVAAQEGVIDAVREELRAGRKRSHWMWFVFPQREGLGTSAMAQRYGIASLDEARAYLAHPVLGPRLRECCALMLAVPERSAHEILGSPDDLKFRSCLTLFALAAPQEALWRDGLDRFHGGQIDPRTTAPLAWHHDAMKQQQQTAGAAPDLRHNEPQSRYELLVDGQVAAFAQYRREGDALRFTHTEVSPEREGQGLAARVAAYALDDARTRGLKAIPQCSYIAGYIARHEKEYGDLVAR